MSSKSQHNIICTYNICYINTDLIIYQITSLPKLTPIIMIICLLFFLYSRGQLYDFSYQNKNAYHWGLSLGFLDTAQHTSVSMVSHRVHIVHIVLIVHGTVPGIYYMSASPNASSILSIVFESSSSSSWLMIGSRAQSL